MNENEEFALKLFEIAKKGEHQKVETITNYATYRAAIITRNALEALTKDFKKEKRANYENYIKELERNIDNVGLLLNYKAMEMCERFYEEECIIISQAIEEYLNYIRSSSSWIKVLLGEERNV